MKEKVIPKVDDLNIVEKSIIHFISGVYSWFIVICLLFKLLIKGLIYISMVTIFELCDLFIFIFYSKEEVEEKQVHSKARAIVISICKHMGIEIAEEKF